MAPAAAWLDRYRQFWTERLDQFEQHFQKKTEREKRT
jgi:hypothetical protein